MLASPNVTALSQAQQASLAQQQQELKEREAKAERANAAAT